MQIERIIVQVLRYCIAVMFIFSAISKVVSLAFFDGLVAELFFGKDYYNSPEGLAFTQVLTRTMISVEMFLGLAVLQEKYLRRIVLPTLALMLIVFTGHLTYVGMEKGFIGGNCGCFGDLIPMDNFESILKNIVMMVMVGVIYFKYKPHYKIGSIAAPIVGGLILYITLHLTIKEYKPLPVFETVPTIEEYKEIALVGDTVNTEIDVDTTTKEVLDQVKESATKTDEKPVKVETKKAVPQPVVSAFSKYTTFSDGKNVNLDEGNKLVCMFSLTCEHCQQSYIEICQLRKEGKLPPVYLLLYGTEFDLNNFWSLTGSKDPYILIEEYVEFKRLLKESDFPKILDRDNGKNKGVWDLETYSKEKLRDHFGIVEKVTPKPPKIDKGSSGFDVDNDDPFGEKKGLFD